MSSYFDLPLTQCSALAIHPPMDHLLDSLITITNQLIQSSTIALSSTISSHQSFLSTYSKFESLIDRSIQTHQLELNLKLDSIHQHQPILNSLLPNHIIPHRPNPWSASSYQLNRSFLRSLLNQHFIPKTTLLQSEKDHQQKVILPTTTTLRTTSPTAQDANVSQPPSKSSPPFNNLVIPSSTFPHFPTRPQTPERVSSVGSPIQSIQSNEQQLDSSRCAHQKSHSIKPARILRSSSSILLSSPIRIEEKASSSVPLPSPTTGTACSLDPDPRPPPDPSPTPLIQIQPPKSSSILVQILSSCGHHHPQDLLGAHSNSSTSPENQHPAIFSNTRPHEPFLNMDASDLLKQMDLDFKLVHSSLHTP